MRRSLTSRERAKVFGGTGFVVGAMEWSDLEKQLEKTINVVAGQGREGKKLLKHASRIALEPINEETAERAQQLQLVPSGKGWRKLLKRKSSYVYKERRTRAYRFWFYTAINYKRSLLRVSHLVEKGFKHPHAGRVAGSWYRAEAFEARRREALTLFDKALRYGLEFIGTGRKVPGLRELRKGTRSPGHEDMSG